MLALLACAAALSCRDGLRPEVPPLSPPAPAARLLGSYECFADRTSPQLVCQETRASEPFPSGARRAVLGNSQIRMASSNVRNDGTTGIMSADVTVQNLLSKPLGTPDGVTATGIKVFFEKGPVVTAYETPGDTGTVTVPNADGAANFTGANQPYHLYREILPPQALSAVKRWEWKVPRTVKTFTFGVRVFAAVPGETPVPPVPPESGISAEAERVLFSTANLVIDHPRMSGPYPRNLIEVAFQPAATQEERQAAVDLVSGTVVGGERIGAGDGFYYIRIPDDGTAGPLWSAVDRLRVLPQVENVGPVLAGGYQSLFVRPSDGPGWEKDDWQTSPDSARGKNWAFEAVSAPLAWGCETGDSSVRIGVVDVTAEHLRHVTTVLDNPANDGAGLAALIWKARITPMDASRSGTVTGVAASFNVYHDLVAAIGSSDVINLSIAITYFDTVRAGATVEMRERKPRDTPADRARAAQAASSTGTRILQAERTSGRHPLYVLAAGNYEVDARFSGLPLLREEPTLGSRVLVVAAADSGQVAPHVRKLWSGATQFGIETGSNTGPLVQVAAPGAQIDFGDPAHRLYGTSYAAPMAAAVAALLKSFDPRLRADSLKTLIVEGARRGGWTSGNYPLLNAYHALRAAAERRGAPLCGNRVWAADGQLWAERVPGTAPEGLGSAPARVAFLSVAHGGRFVAFQSVLERTIVNPPADTVFYDTLAPGAVEHLRFPAPHWHATSPAAPASLVPGGVARSSVATSHDGDTVATVYVDSRWNFMSSSSVPEETERITLYLDAGSGTQSVTVHEYNIGQGANRHTMCNGSGTNLLCDEVTRQPPREVSRFAKAAYSPRGNYILVAVSRYKADVDTGSIILPPEARAGLEIWSADHYRWRPSRTDLFRVSLPSLSVTPVRAIADTAVFWMGISEAGDEAVLALGRDLDDELYLRGSVDGFKRRRSLQACGMEYRDTLFSVQRKRVSTTDVCPDVYGAWGEERQGPGGGSMAPNRLPRSSRRVARPPERSRALLPSRSGLVHTYIWTLL